MFKKILSCLMSAMMVLGLTILPTHALEGTATGTQKAFVVGDDWGAGVTKSIITFDKKIKADSISKTDFLVKETATNKVSDRTILDAYASDAQGNKVTTDSNIVTVEMYISPSEGNPISWNNLTWKNAWADPYQLEVTLAAGETLVSENETITTIDVDPTINVAEDGKICPQLDGFKMSEFTNDGTTVSYALYTPENDSHKNALVIWNHGVGETGTDVQIDLLGNEVTALAGDEFQNTMDGAYVLVPQRRSYDSTSNAEAIYQLILKTLRENPDIDQDRIIIGGCSAGGAMTMTMIIAHPELYAAAYPICPATQSANVSDETIESLKDLPIWFTHAKNDSTVAIATTTEPLVERLRAAGAEVHTSIFDDVHDTTGRFSNEDGTPYQYDGHWSWTYFDNNECYDENGVNLWQWMSVQTKADKVIASGSQKAYIIGDDWGPAVTKTVISLDKAIDADSVVAENFKVVEEKEATINWGTGEIGIATADRNVTAAYTSDAQGNKVTGSSKYITIEMYVSPSEGSPFIYNLKTGFNSWCTPYKLNVSLAKGATMSSGDEVVTDLNIKADIDVAGDGKICPQGEVFEMKAYTAKDGTTYSYADYTPAKDDKKNALVIWLHGAGEGGTDPYIDILGNEVTSLVSKEFQSLFEGAYVLAPQSPTMWMDDGTGAYQNGDKGSMYAESLFEMIDAYVKANDDIDPNRVIIGGCSNGGYMTMEMVLKHPTYFAAAFPICEAFQDQYITDDQINAIKDMPIWFTYAKNDGTVDPTLCVEPTVARLLAAGANNIHVSVFDDVHDTTGRFFNEDGTPYQYNGHWSWIYFDNNECYDENGVNAWQWLAKQIKTAAPVETPDQPTTPDQPANSVKTGDDVNFAGLGAIMMLTLAGFYVSRRKYN